MTILELEQYFEKHECKAWNPKEYLNFKMVSPRDTPNEMCSGNDSNVYICFKKIKVFICKSNEFCL